MSRFWCTCKMISTFFALFLIVPSVSFGAENGSKEISPQPLLVETGLCAKPEQMMQNWLFQEVQQARTRWEVEYEKIKMPEEIASYQQSRIDYFFKQLGPMWSKTPLNAKVLATEEKENYRMEKILFESVPGFYVSGVLFLPKDPKFKAPYPAVLVLCGHTGTGKAAPGMNKLCILGAQYGLAMFIIDPIEQGDRLQQLDSKGVRTCDSVASHNIVGGSSILVGRNTATFEVWDMIRALDYLQTRSDVIPDRLGAAGISGGGTQTSYIMALDPRVRVAAPCCYLCMFDGLLHDCGPQDAEQNIFGQLGFGMDHADYCIMRAPKPTLLCTTTRDFFPIRETWNLFRSVTRIYGRLNCPDQIALAEIDDIHTYNPRLHEATVRWMLRFLADQPDVTVTEAPDLKPLSEEEIRVLPAPGIAALPKARTTFDLNRDLAAELTIKRAELWKTMPPEKAAELVRSVARIRSDQDRPMLKVIEKSIRNNEFAFESDPGIFLPVRSNIESNPERITLFISDQGRNSAGAKKLFNAKANSVVSVELRGWGESQAVGRKYYAYDQFGSDGSDYYIAYLLGRSYIGMRTDDLLAVSDWLQKKYNVPIELVAEGNAGLVALHAAAVEPTRFRSVQIEKDKLSSWTELVEKSPTPIRLTNTIHGVLHSYDIDDLIRLVNPETSLP